MNRNYSLKKNHDIQKLLSFKQSVGNKFYVIYFAKNDKKEIAVSISKKLGKAVERNYQKRVLKEIIRKNIEAIDDLRMLIIIKEKSLTLDFSSKKSIIEQLLSKINNSSNKN